MNIYHLVALILPYSTGYKGARVLNTLYALELGAGPLAIGALLAMYAVFPLLLAVYAGRASDRYGARVPLGAGMAVMSVGICVPFVVPSLPALFVSAVITGLGFIFVQVSGQALTGSLGTGEARTRNFNIYVLAVATADFTGPVVAGLLIDFTGHVRTYLVLGLLCAVSALGVASLFRRFPRAAQRAAGSGAHRMADLLRDAGLRRVFIAGAVVFAALDLFQLYMPLYGRSVGLSASAIGLVLGAFAAATFVVRAMITWLVRRFGEEPTLVASMFAAAASCLLIPFFTNVWVLAAIAFAFGLGLGLGQPLSVMLTYNYSPAGRAGEALGLRIAINNVIHVAVPVVFGAAGALVGLAPVFFAKSALLALGAHASRRKAQ